MQNESSNDASGTNTVLIVIVLLILVAFGVWWLATHKNTPAADTNDLNIQVDLPGGNTNPPGGNPSPSPSPNPAY